MRLRQGARHPALGALPGAGKPRRVPACSARRLGWRQDGERVPSTCSETSASFSSDRDRRMWAERESSHVAAAHPRDAMQARYRHRLGIERTCDGLPLHPLHIGGGGDESGLAFPVAVLHRGMRVHNRSMHVARFGPWGRFHGKAGRAHARAISGTSLSPRPSLASGPACSSPAASKQSSEGSQVSDGFGSTARQDVHGSSRRGCVSLTAASNPVHTRRAGGFGLQTLPRDGQINERVSSVKAQIDIPAPRPSASNPVPSRVAGPPLLTK